MNHASTDLKLDKKTRELFRAILSLRNTSECQQFFRDLLTSDEIREFGERWYVAQCVDKGLSYREISALTGLSTTTVTRVAKWLKQGSGYQLALKRQKKAENISARRT